MLNKLFTVFVCFVNRTANKVYRQFIKFVMRRAAKLSSNSPGRVRICLGQLGKFWKVMAAFPKFQHLFNARMNFLQVLLNVKKTMEIKLRTYSMEHQHHLMCYLSWTTQSSVGFIGKWNFMIKLGFCWSMKSGRIYKCWHWRRVPSC